MLNPEKSKKLRPVRILLAILTAALLILVLDRLPTSRTVVKSTTATSVNSPETEILSAGEISETFSKNPDAFSPETVYFCTFTGLLSDLETDLETRLADLGVPEEEYNNLGEYLEKDEIYALELKANLAASLETSVARATPSDLLALSQVLSLTDASSTCTPDPAEEYKELSSLLEEYRLSTVTVEDYDEVF